jgi:hypothetical protein
VREREVVLVPSVQSIVFLERNIVFVTSFPTQWNKIKEEIEERRKRKSKSKQINLKETKKKKKITTTNHNNKNNNEN